MLSLALMTMLVSQPPTLSEDFGSVGGLVNRGWSLKNNSSPSRNDFPGWFRGDAGAGATGYWAVRPRLDDPFAAIDGTGHYLAANYRTAGGTADVNGAISLWAITPALKLTERETLQFWTRSSGSVADRLQVRLSTTGTNCGNAPVDVADFGDCLLDINPTYLRYGYPSQWKFYEVKLPHSVGRPSYVAFRYFVERSGALGPNGDYIGIDSLTIGGR